MLPLDIPRLQGPRSKTISTPLTAAASLASTNSGRVDGFVGEGVGALVGAGDGERVGAAV